MADHKAVSPLKEDPPSAKEAELETRAEELDYEPQLSPMPDVLEPCQQPGTNTSNSASSASSTTNSRNPPLYPYPASITIQTLQQQLYTSEQDTLALRQQAGQHIHELEVLIHNTWQRSNALEANVSYLTAELEKANAYIVTAERDMRDLRMEAVKKEKQHCEAVEQARKTAAVSAVARVVPPMQDSNTLLEHNRTTIRVLRAEIRGLKEGKKGLQKQLIELGEGSGAMAGVRELPRWAEARVSGDVLEEWNEVLVGKERKIVGLQVMLEREREER